MASTYIKTGNRYDEIIAGTPGSPHVEYATPVIQNPDEQTQIALAAARKQQLQGGYAPKHQSYSQANSSDILRRTIESEQQQLADAAQRKQNLLTASVSNQAAVDAAQKKAAAGINPLTPSASTQQQQPAQLTGGGTYTAESGYAGIPPEVLQAMLAQQAAPTMPSYAQILQDAQAAQLAAYAAAVDAAIQGYETQRQQLAINADEARAAAYANGRLAAIGNNEELAAAGLAGNLYASPTTGYSETSRIAQDNALRSNINDVYLAQLEAEAEIDRAIAQARANGEIEKANMIAANAQQLIQLQMQEAEMAYQRQLQQQQMDLAKAETLAAYGDFSGYADLGWDVAMMQQAYNDAQALERAKALASSRGTEPAVEITSGSFFTEMMASPNPVQYLAQNAYQLTDAQLKQLYPYALDWLEAEQAAVESNVKTETELAKREQEQAERAAAIAAQDAKFEMLDRWYRSNTEAAFERILAQKYLDGTITQNDIDAWTKARGID